VLARPERPVRPILGERHAILEPRRGVRGEEVRRHPGEVEVAIGGDARVVHGVSSGSRELGTASRALHMPGLYPVSLRKGRGLAALVVAAVMLVLATNPARSDERPGEPPPTPWTCPPSHPFNGYLTVHSGLGSFRPGGRFYEEASRTRCYAAEEEARRDGARRAPEDEPVRR